MGNDKVRPMRKVATWYLGIVEHINRIALSVIAAGMAIMFAVTLLQVIVRFLLTQFNIMASVPWAEELARYVLIWIVFLGAGVVCRKGQLVALKYFINAVPARIGIPAQYLAIAISLAFYLFLIWIGMVFMQLGAAEHSPVMRVPKNWVYWAMPVGAALMIVNTLAFVAEVLRDSGDIRKDEELAVD